MAQKANFVAVLLLTLVMLPADACSTFMYNLSAYNGYAVSARTLDFEIALPTDLVTLKPGTVWDLFPVAGANLSDRTPFIQSKLSPVTVKYAIATMSEERVKGCLSFAIPLDRCIGATMDGLNEAGLTASVLWDTSYGGYGLYSASGPEAALNILDIPSYVLASFANVSEIRAFLNPAKIQLVFNEEGVKNLLEQAPGFLLGGNGLSAAPDDARVGAKLPLHMIFRDKYGDSAVLEWVNTTVAGGWVLRDNPLNILTNSPNLPEQYRLLEEYKLKVAPQIRDRSPTSENSTWWPVPGSWLSSDRFQRLWFLNQAPAVAPWPSDSQNKNYSPGSQQFPTSRKALYGAMSIIQALMLPQGLDDRGGYGAQGDKYQYTVITTLHDHTNPTLYWRTASNAMYKGLALADIAKQDRNIKALPVIDYDRNWYTPIKP